MNEEYFYKSEIHAPFKWDSLHDKIAAPAHGYLGCIDIKFQLNGKDIGATMAEVVDKCRDGTVTINLIKEVEE